jgi:hypothetical protein
MASVPLHLSCLLARAVFADGALLLKQQRRTDLAGCSAQGTVSCPCIFASPWLLVLTVKRASLVDVRPEAWSPSDSTKAPKWSRSRYPGCRSRQAIVLFIANLYACLADRQLQPADVQLVARGL